jgi:asparagine synthase (glutamine-hydrolysing)
MFISGNVGLGNNRLSIIDVSSKGHQPMFDDEKSLCIVYNGEMYNFKRLRAELARDFKFKSNTDTEVIIYAYKKWGKGCLNYFSGMFSFVIFDIKNNLLFGARDRRGEKPLKYYFDGKNFIFASEVKAILPVLKDKPEMDMEAISDYLTLQYVPAPRTGFKNIYKLPSASYFVFKDGKLKINRYWDLDYSEKLNISENDWMELLETKVNECVKSRMISDVPIGSFLSGGVDSSAVTAFMARNSSNRIKTFSIGFSDPKFDETQFSKQVAKKYNTEHFYIKINPKVFKDELPKMSDYYDEPFADNSLIPTLFLSRFARREVTVALSGDGGDENFAGYDRYNIVAFGEIYKKVPKLLRKWVIRPATNSLFLLSPNLFTSRLKSFSDSFEDPFYKRYMAYKSFFSQIDKNKVFSGYMKSLKLHDTYNIDKGRYNNKLSNLDNALKSDLGSYMPEDLLYKVDIASMSTSLEVRAPLLDYKLMELTAKMPDSLKINNFNTKYIFKKMLVEKGILPRNVVYRPKRGFNAPIGNWLKGDLKEYVIEQLTDKKFRHAQIFDNERLDDYIKAYYQGNLNYHNNMFALLVLSNWIQKHF